MKKVLSLLLSVFLMLSFTACSGLNSNKGTYGMGDTAHVSLRWGTFDITMKSFDGEVAVVNIKALSGDPEFSHANFDIFKNGEQISYTISQNHATLLEGTDRDLKLFVDYATFRDGDQCIVRFTSSDVADIRFAFDFARGQNSGGSENDKRQGSEEVQNIDEILEKQKADKEQIGNEPRSTGDTISGQTDKKDIVQILYESEADLDSLPQELYGLYVGENPYVTFKIKSPNEIIRTVEGGDQYVDEVLGATSYDRNYIHIIARQGDEELNYWYSAGGFLSLTRDRGWADAAPIHFDYEGEKVEDYAPVDSSADSSSGSYIKHSGDPLDGVPESIFGTYVGGGFTFVISSPNEIIRIQDGTAHTDRIVRAEGLECYTNGEYSHDYGLHIMAIDSDGNKMDYLFKEASLTLSSRVDWESPDFSYVAVEARRTLEYMR